jgi:hypothetical protein
MAAKLYRTSDIAASIRKAHEAFTHVTCCRSYASLRPPFFRSERLDVAPIYSYASWIPESAAQLERWRAGGGVLISRDSMPDAAGETDVMVLAECPFSMARVTRAAGVTLEHVVIPVPIWRIHDEAIDARTPPVETLQEIWKVCRGKRMTDQDLADATGIPRSRLTYMRARLRPREEWEMRPRLAPDAAALLPAWNWLIGDGVGCTAERKAVRLAGHRAAVRELARRGHVAMTKYQVYDAAEPVWQRLEDKRVQALADLAAVRALVDSLPSHLEV